MEAFFRKNGKNVNSGKLFRQCGFFEGFKCQALVQGLSHAHTPKAKVRSLRANIFRVTVYLVFKVQSYERFLAKMSNLKGPVYVFQRDS